MALNSQQLMAATMRKGPEKLTAVTGLMEKLDKDLSDASLPLSERDSALEELKIYGRDPRDADPIFTTKGIQTLTRYAFDSDADSTGRNALRCLCNAMLLNQSARQEFVNLGYQGKACSKLESDNRDDEFLLSRLLFLTTYETNIDLNALVEKHKLGDALAKILERHIERRTRGDAPAEPIEGLALVETLKLIFNISHHCPQKTSEFSSVIAPVITLLSNDWFETKQPLDSPIMFLINALLNVDLGAADVQSSIFPEDAPSKFPERLISLLDQSRKSYQDEQLESTVTPLVGVLRAIHEYAPATVKGSIRTQLLPSESDRAEVLGESKSLPSWLLKTTTNALTPQLRVTVADLLFDMSDKDPQIFVANVGYGFASGYLFSKNIPVPENATETEGASTKPVNPITGQFLDKEKQPDIPEMSEEEKEREAERLFVLFERLRANGVISAENPVRTALEEGRFEELPDEDVD